MYCGAVARTGDVEVSIIDLIVIIAQLSRGWTKMKKCKFRCIVHTWNLVSYASDRKEMTLIVIKKFTFYLVSQEKRGAFGGLCHRI